MYLNEGEVRISLEHMKGIVDNALTDIFHGMHMKKKSYQKIEIRTAEDSTALTQVFIGGEKIEGIRNWNLSHKAGEFPVLHIDINAMNLDVDGVFVCTAEGWGEFAMRMIPPDSEEMEKEGE